MFYRSGRPFCYYGIYGSTVPFGNDYAMYTKSIRTPYDICQIVVIGKLIKQQYQWIFFFTFRI
jgi:hypothetical protein